MNTIIVFINKNEDHGMCQGQCPIQSKNFLWISWYPLPHQDGDADFHSTKQRSVAGHKEEGKANKITSFCTKSSASPYCTQHHLLSLPILSQEHRCHSNKHQHKYVCFNLHMIIVCAYCLPYPIFPIRSSFWTLWFHLGLFHECKSYEWQGFAIPNTKYESHLLLFWEIHPYSRHYILTKVVI